MKGLKTISLLLFMALFAYAGYAQDKADAITAYNAGLEQAKGKDFEAAISSFTQAATIADGLGADGTDIKSRSEKQIPKMYYQKALVAFKSFQSSKNVADLDQAIAQFDEASGVATEYGDDALSKRISGVMPQLYYQKSVKQLQAGDAQSADASVSKALEMNSNYALAYYQKALVHKNLNEADLDGMVTFLDQAIQVGEATRKNQVVRRAKAKAHDELLFAGAKQIETRNFSKSLELLNKALAYDAESADVYYRIAEASNQQGSYDKAIQNATQALQFEKGGRTDKAKIYFELGLAHQAKDNKGPACEALKNASYGSFKAPSEHKMEFELKCKTAAPGN
ncbi:MAG: hypothetical protein AAFW89_11640 [Bacteroidota bacterium]